MMKAIDFFSGVAVIGTALGVVAPGEANARKTVHNGLIGAAGGAVVGAMLPGMSMGSGALIGGAGGAAIGMLDHGDRRWYRDGRGRHYYVDRQGRRRYR